MTCLKLVSSYLRSNQLRSSHPRSYKKILFGLCIKIITLLLEELKAVAKIRKVKDKSYDELIKILSEPKPKIDFSKVEIEEIRKKLMN